MRLFQLFLVVAVTAGSGAACAKVRANTEPAMPVLMPPPPPPRIVEAYVDDLVPTIEPGPVETALATPPAPAPSRPPAPRPEVAKPEPARTEEPERPPLGAPALTLKPLPGMEAKTQASIRALLDRAMRDLQKVKYAALDADGRAQYDTARRFMDQAEDAIKNSNLAFAGKLADKAATMAAILVR